MTLGIRERRHAFLGLTKIWRSVAADDGENSILLRLPESGFETEPVPVEGNGLIDIAYDEGW